MARLWAVLWAGLVALSLVYFIAFSSAYNAPERIPVQGRLLNASTGNALVGIYAFTFRVYNASTGGSLLWEENQSIVVGLGGLWNSYLGNVSAMSLNYSEDTYLEVEINHDCDPLPRVRLASVPYSKRTDVAANLSCMDCVTGMEINESTLSGVNASQLQGQSSGYYLNTSTNLSNSHLHDWNNISGRPSSLGNSTEEIRGAVNSSGLVYLFNSSGLSCTDCVGPNQIQDAYLLNDGDNATGNYTINGSLRIDNSTGSAVLYVNTSNGFVGIGTTSPNAKLHIATNMVNDGLIINNTGYGSLITLYADTNGFAINFPGSNRTDVYNRYGDSWHNDMTFKNGNVGIGTNSPGYKLTVAGINGTVASFGGESSSVNFGGSGSAAPNGYIGAYYAPAGNASTSYFSSNLHWNGTTFVVPDSAQNTSAMFHSKGNILFHTGTTTVGTEKMRISNNGSVGIGTAGPDAKLTLQATGSGTGELIESWKNPGGATRFTFLYDAINIKYSIGGRSSNPFLTIVETSGNVGIGTTNPELPLDVEGDIEVGTGTTGCVRDSDNTTLVGSCVSDLRLKDNVRPLEGVLGRVSGLRPVSFTWKGGNVTEYGLVAQEVQKVMPELVAEDEDGYLRVSYDTKLFMLMLESVKELKEENEALKRAVCEINPDSAVCGAYGN